MINAEDLHRADRTLAIAAEIGIGNAPKERQFRRALVRREDYETYLKHHQETLARFLARGAEGDLEIAMLKPPQQAAVNTMMTHFFLAGVVAGREAERK